MKTINTVFLILFVSLAASPLFAQSDLSIGSLKTESEINTFVQIVDYAGGLMATVQAADGGYVTVSGSVSDENSVLVRKIKVSGQKQWERRLYFLYAIDSFASINGIAQTMDGGFILVGESGDFFRFVSRSEATLVKLRSNGTVAWRKSFRVSGQDTRFSSVIATPDGGVIAIGAIVADSRFSPSPWPLVVRFAATGDVVWGKSFKRIAAVFPYVYPLIISAATSDNGFIVAFPTVNLSTVPSNGVDVMKITNSGNVVWEKLLKTGSAFVFQSAGVTADDGVMLVGARADSNKLKVIVLRPNGTIRWKAGYSLKVPGKAHSVSSPIQTPDGGFVLTGGSYDTLVKENYGFIAKIDSSRKVAFQNTFGALGKSVFTTPDGIFFLVGGVGADILFSKMNSEGIVAGCDFFQSLGETKRTSFGRLKIHSVNITESNVLSLEATDFRLTSVVSSHPVSTVCH
jgi:hypothetical protein